MKSLGGARAGWPRVLQGMLTDCLEDATKKRMGHRIWRINRDSGCTACGLRAESTFLLPFPNPAPGRWAALVPVLVVQFAGGTGVLPAPAEIPESIPRVA